MPFLTGVPGELDGLGFREEDCAVAVKAKASFWDENEEVAGLCIVEVDFRTMRFGLNLLSFWGRTGS